MNSKCKYCPFHEMNLGQREIANKVRERCITEASQICHHPRLSGKKETHLCRGARDYQQQIFYRIGVIDAPTDEAWERKLTTTENTWIEAYLNGEELEESFDKISWHDCIEEPSIGFGKYYRVKKYETHSTQTESRQ